ncbi:MAG: apolipoprotein N-acyltransferase [Desulfobacterales bacterium]|nr:apolipoprotein N-acyltransferase [Desulfobacterales bacterium]
MVYTNVKLNIYNIAIGYKFSSIYAVILKKNRLKQKILLLKSQITLPLLSGLILTIAFPKLCYAWFIWFAFIPINIALCCALPKKGFYYGFICGYIHYLTLLYWLIHTFINYAYFNWILALLILLLFCAYLALYFGIFFSLIAWLCSKPATLLFLFPILWVALEYIRSFLFSGFPWELIGYSQYANLYLIQIADIFGVYGISYLIAFFNVSIFLLFLYFTKKKWHGVLIEKQLVRYIFCSIIIIFGSVFLYNYFQINSLEKLFNNVKSIRAGIVQGNIEQLDKWEAKHQTITIEKYINLSYKMKDDKPDIVIWPETALPFYYTYDVKLSKLVEEGIKKNETDFLVGSPSFTRDNDLIKYYNSAYLINAKGEPLGKYDKIHLVPFGEYVPIKNFLPFINKLVEGVVGDFSSGKIGQILNWNKCGIGVQICFEILFPELSIAAVKNGAELIITITNDGWFGDTSAPYQHFSMAVFRAVENKRSLIRSANTGISGFVNPIGKVLGMTDIFQDKTLLCELPIINKKTIYNQFGDVFAIFCVIIMICCIIHKIIYIRR